MRKKLLHVLGGGQWQLPTIELAGSLGYSVLVTDMYKERPAYALADRHEVCDIADYDATLAVARRHEIDGIICDTTDAGVPTAAWVAEQLGLPGIGFEVAQRFTNKYQMRQLTNRAGVQNVCFEPATSRDELRAAVARIGFPLIVKPIDNQSSRGVHRINDVIDIEAAFDDALASSRSKIVLVEEVLPGIEVTVEGCLFNGRYRTLGISDKAHFPHRPEVACRLTYPAAFDAKVLKKIAETNEAVVSTLGLQTGVTHAEYMVHGDSVRLVEIAARGGGSRIYSHIAPYLGGMNVQRAFLQFVLGEQLTLDTVDEPRAANLEFFSFPCGRVKRIHGFEEARALPGTQEILLEFGVGDVLQPPIDDRSRPGLMVVFGKTRAEVLATTEKIKTLVRVEVE